MDHCVKQKRQINPRETTNIFSLCTFLYTAGLFKKGYKKDLEEEDIYEIVDSCRSKNCGDELEKEWKIENEKHVKHPSIYRLLWNCFGYKYIIFGIITLLWKIFVSVCEPHAMSSLVSYFKPDQKEVTRNEAIMYAFVVASISGAHCFYTNNYGLMVQKYSLKIRASFCSLIYRKTLKLTPSALSEVSLGNIVTLITKDVKSFESCLWIMNDLWVGFGHSLILFYLIYQKMGWVSFVGVGVMVIFMPIQIYLGKMVAKLRLEICKRSDERLQVTQEALSAIRIIKMFTWEQIFNDKVTALRSKEVRKLMNVFYIFIVIYAIGVLTSRIGFYILVMLYIWLGYTTTADQMFYVLYCFVWLRHTLVILIPHGVASMSELYTSLYRINKIITGEEYPEQLYQKEEQIFIKPKIELKSVSVSIKDTKILSDVSFKLENGLSLVSGPVGAGKSALLKTILEDYPLLKGDVIVQGRISYASQDPWVFPSSIKQNIIFKEPFNPTRYQEVIRVCALKYDLDLLENGDETIISDKGINLSRGQQARINLARAIYKDSEIYLLDDSLTALDTRVQEYIFNECIKGYLKDKLCILVTHNLDYVKEADNVINMKQGFVKYFGKPDECCLKNMSNMIVENGIESNYDAPVFVEPDVIVDESSKLLGELCTLGKKKVYKEVKKSGGVDVEVYKKYFRFGGGLIVFGFIVVIFVFAQFTETYSDKLISTWITYQQNITDMKEANNTTSLFFQETVRKNDETVVIYSTMILASSVLVLLKYYTLLNFGRKASLHLHKFMSTNILNAVVAFFDTHFIGNILNRFSQDLSTVDELLPFTLTECIAILFSLIGSLTLIASTNWKFLIPMPLFALAVISLRFFYMPTGRSLKRLEAATKSPMVGYMNSTLEGLTTIRAFKAEDILRDEFDRFQDVYTSANFMMICTIKALGYCLDSLCTLLLTMIICRFLFFDTDASVGNVGMAMTQAIELADYVQWGIRFWADLENNMTSVERCLEYTEIKTENKSGQLIENWPTHGKIEYENVNLTYINTNERVLKDINFVIQPKQKIGIVGRTGSGKSSIISALFRLYDFEGTIKVDSVDTKIVNLNHLRQSIAIIPQDPILFTGTIRSNIDLVGNYTDKEIWQAIEKVQIKDLVPSLDMIINEKDQFFSAGQRQLICLARAIVRSNKIVIMDEATANMDPETDSLLHKIINECFSDCTVLTVAHRLHTVLDSDKIMVLDRGELIEFDTPSNLLDNRESTFHKMVHHSGVLTSSY